MSPGKFDYPNRVRVMKVSHSCCSGIILLYIYGIRVYKCHTKSYKNEILLEEHGMLLQ